MIKLNINSEEYEWEFEGLKIIHIANTTKFHLKILKAIETYDFSLEIDHCPCNVSNILHLSEYTKVKDLINLNKSNQFCNYLNQEIPWQNFIDFNGLENKIQELNNRFNNDLLDIDKDLAKLISNLISLENNRYITWQDLFTYLSINKNNSTKQVIIINNISWLQLEKLQEFFNYYNFIILTNDLPCLLQNFSCENWNGIFAIIGKHNDLDVIDFFDFVIYLNKWINRSYEFQEVKQYLCNAKNNTSEAEEISKFLHFF